MTTKQAQVLEAVRSYQTDYGYSPTVRELADVFGQSSTAGIHKILKVLREKGYLTKTDGKSRSLNLVDTNPDFEARSGAKSYPILGQVQAGMPQLAYEDKEGEMMLDEEWAGDEDTFLLRVKGQSMIDADIRDGDIIVVKQTQSCHNGDIVIALLDDEATVKRFYKEHDRIRLQPENPTMQPIYIDRDHPNFSVIGLVRGLLRKY
ncbi:MAG: transcriptional repressor LexA [candidate division KSB1 bacterium]|nr:transcriptional repressor LexA [candidate division KSB1 bacterium]